MTVLTMIIANQHGFRIVWNAVHVYRVDSLTSPPTWPSITSQAASRSYTCAGMSGMWCIHTWVCRCVVLENAYWTSSTQVSRKYHSLYWNCVWISKLASVHHVLLSAAAGHRKPKATQTTLPKDCRPCNDRGTDQSMGLITFIKV